MMMEEVEWLMVAYSVSVQPLLVRYVAKNYKHTGEKILLVALLSILSGGVLYYLEYGRFEGVKDLLMVMKMIGKVVFFSFGAWTSIWKRVFPYKEDPLKDVVIKKNYKKLKE